MNDRFDWLVILSSMRYIFFASEFILIFASILEWRKRDTLVYGCKWCSIYFLHITIGTCVRLFHLFICVKKIFLGKMIHIMHYVKMVLQTLNSFKWTKINKLDQDWNVERRKDDEEEEKGRDREKKTEIEEKCCIDCQWFIWMLVTAWAELYWLVINIC